MKLINLSSEKLNNWSLGSVYFEKLAINIVQQENIKKYKFFLTLVNSLIKRVQTM